MRKTIVLVHGSWHGGWAWNAVAHELSRKGHYPHAPTLAGHGPNTNRLGITHKDCVDSVTAYIRYHQLKDIILVGHSFGGSVVQKVVEQLSDRIESVVFVDALILADSQCVFDNLPVEYVAAFNDLASASSDNTMLIPWEIWRDSFMQDTPESVARSIWEQLTPEPNQVNLDKLDLKRFYSLDVPKSLIFCRQDKALPQGHFHPGVSSRLGAFKLLEMDGSHEAMFTRPLELAENIVEVSLEGHGRAVAVGKRNATCSISTSS